MNKIEEFVRWLFSCFAYRYNVKTQEDERFHNEVTEKLQSLINSVKQEQKEKDAQIANDYDTLWKERKNDNRIIQQTQNNIAKAIREQEE